MTPAEFIELSNILKHDYYTKSIGGVSNRDDSDAEN